MQNRERDLGILVGAIIAGLLLSLLIAGGMMSWGMMGPGMMGWGGYNLSPWWGIAMMVFWVLIVGGVTLLAVWLLRQDRSTAGSSRALDLLKERYARGEITREQYEQMRRDLEA